MPDPTTNPTDEFEATHVVEDEFEPAAATTAEIPEAEPGSLLDQIHQRTKEIGQQRYKIFDIPGYEGLLAVRLKPVPWETIKKMGKKVKRMSGDEFDKMLPASADTLIQACDEILGFVDDEPVPLKDVPAIAARYGLNEDSPPVKFDRKLYEIVHPAPGDTTHLNARDIVSAVISDETALTDFAETFSDWQRSMDLGDGVPEKSERLRSTT